MGHTHEWRQPSNDHRVPIPVYGRISHEIINLTGGRFSGKIDGLFQTSVFFYLLRFEVDHRSRDLFLRLCFLHFIIVRCQSAHLAQSDAHVHVVVDDRHPILSQVNVKLDELGALLTHNQLAISNTDKGGF